MKDQSTYRSRRQFLQSSTGLAAACSLTPYWFSTKLAYGEHHAANDRPCVGCIGVGSRWLGGLREEIYPFANIVALADVDAHYADRGRAKCGEDTGRYPDVYEDYRYLLDRDDIDAVSIATPDHWHTKIAIEALRSGKDVYCEKPVTLTIDEGKRLCKVVEETGRVFQVGTQQRTEMGRRFLQALALVQEGRLGELKRARVAIGGAPSSGSIPVVEPPKHLNWEFWLGQAPLVDYRFRDEEKNAHGIETRGHYEFRWWYEYSGGKLTDWGAHHVDIAQWAIGMADSGPTEVELVSVNHPVEFKNGMPTQDDRYNTATSFDLHCTFPNGVEMSIRDSVDDDDAQFGNGIMLEGTEGRIFVSRSSLSGKPYEDLKDHPLPEDALDKVYGGKVAPSHMANFFDCVKTRKQPISDIFTHHRALSTCHLCNIAMRLGRSLKWDPVAQQIVGDEEANAWQTREQRKGYEIPS
ncbi:MAG: Gfo/Idh/MocA family oxidoreductase [Planctomycetales bacterium]|nr:Gfo/Idh/MocA family oxidoreductase [Planctomycetales bacterium]